MRKIIAKIKEREHISLPSRIFYPLTQKKWCSFPTNRCQKLADFTKKERINSKDDKVLTKYNFQSEGNLRNLTFTRSASDSGLEETSRFSNCVTKSITGNGSMKAVEDISVQQIIVTIRQC